MRIKLKTHQKILFIQILCVVGVVGGILLLLRSGGEDIRKAFVLSSLDNYVLIEFPHHHIYIKNNEDSRLAGQHYGNFLENYYQEFLRQFQTKLHLTFSEKKITLLLFETEKEFRAYTARRHLTDMPFNAGFYDPKERLIAFYLEDILSKLLAKFENKLSEEEKELFSKADEIKILTMVHERVHSILDFSLSLPTKPHFSSCLNEGMACFFENAFDSSSPPSSWFQLNYSLKKRKSFIQTAISNNSWLSLRELINADQKAFSSSANQYFYYQSELLVYYLWNFHHESFLKWYTLELEPGALNYYQFAQIFPDIEAFEKEWKNYLLTH